VCYRLYTHVKADKSPKIVPLTSSNNSNNVVISRPFKTFFSEPHRILPLTRDETVIREIEKVDNSTDRIIEIRGVERSTSIRGSMLKVQPDVLTGVNLDTDFDELSDADERIEGHKMEVVNFDDLSSDSSSSVSIFSSSSSGSISFSSSSDPDIDTDFDELSDADERIEGQKKEVVVDESKEEIVISLSLSSSSSSISFSNSSSRDSYLDTDFDELSDADERVESQKEEVVVNESIDNMEEEIVTVPRMLRKRAAEGSGY